MRNALGKVLALTLRPMSLLESHHEYCGKGGGGGRGLKGPHARPVPGVDPADPPV